MKVITNILISVLSFAISYGIAHLTGSVIVKNAVLLAYVIHWIAYIPAYVFQTEKFYDLTGSVTYLSVVWESEGNYGYNLRKSANLRLS